jgi:ubiquitin-conjugating enzyme E2 W
MASVSSRRLRKELSEIHAEGCPCGNSSCLSLAHLFTPQRAGIKLLSADDFETWHFSIEVLGESIYQASPLRPPYLQLNSVSR